MRSTRRSRRVIAFFVIAFVMLLSGCAGEEKKQSAEEIYLVKAENDGEFQVKTVTDAQEIRKVNEKIQKIKDSEWKWSFSMPLIGGRGLTVYYKDGKKTQVLHFHGDGSMLIEDNDWSRAAVIPQEDGDWFWQIYDKTGAEEVKMGVTDYLEWQEMHFSDLRLSSACSQTEVEKDLLQPVDFAYLFKHEPNGTVTGAIPNDEEMTLAAELIKKLKDTKHHRTNTLESPPEGEYWLYYKQGQTWHELLLNEQFIVLDGALADTWMIEPEEYDETAALFEKMTSCTQNMDEESFQAWVFELR